MQYFQDLLNSYKKLKARKLKLTESSDPEQRARQEYQNAKSFHPEPSLDRPYVAKAARTRVAIFKTTKGWKYAPVAHTRTGGQVNPGGSRFIDQDWERYVGYFKESEGKDNVAEPKEVEGQEVPEEQETEFELESGSEGEPGMAYMPSEMATELAPIIGDIYASIPKNLTEGKLWGDPMTFQGMVFGPTPDSLESQINAPKVKIQHNKLADQYLTTMLPPDDNIKGIENNFKYCLEILLKNNISDTDKQKIKNMFAINSDKSVSVFSDTSDSGLVFLDLNGFIKMLVSALSKKFKIKIRRINVPELNHVDWALRGLGFNEVFSLLSFHKQFQLLQLLNPVGSQSLFAGMTQSMLLIKTKLIGLLPQYQTWFNNLNITGSYPEDKQIIDSFTTLLDQQNASKFLQIALGNIQKTFNECQADFIVPRLRELEEGRKQDTFLVYKDFGAAKSYLTKLGFTDQEITLTGMVKQLNVEEVFRTREDLLLPLLQSQSFLPGQIVFYIPIWFNNYYSLNSQELGYSNSKYFTNLLSGLSKDPQHLFMNKFKEIFVNVDLNKVNELNNEFIDLTTKIYGLEYKVKSRIETTDKLIDYNLFDDFVKSCLNIIRTNSSYQDLYNSFTEDQSLKDLTSLLFKYLNLKENNEDLVLKIKSFISNIIINRKLIDLIEKNEPHAKGYLAMKLFNSIGSVDNSLLTYNSDLSLNRVSVIQQNDLAFNIIAGWYTDNPEWQLRAKGFTFTFHNLLNPQIKLTMKDYPKVELFETKVFASEELLKKFTKSSPTNEAILNALLSNQKMLFEALMTVKPIVGKSQQILKLN